MFGLGEYELNIRLQILIFLQGLIDSLSFHRTIPDLVNNSTAATVMGKILVANGVLILGSLVLFHRGIVPFLDILGQDSFDRANSRHYEGLLWFVYRWLWLGPICVLCYVCCLAWYSELGASLKKKVPTQSQKSMDFLNQSLQTIYALLVWVVAFAQLQLINNVIPMMISVLEVIVERVLVADTSSTASFSIQAMSFVRSAVLQVVHLLKLSNTVMGWLLMTTLYAWYCFDPIWIAQGVNPDERFSRIHKHLSYFLGFGIPYTILLKNTSFFVGFAIFLMVFPLSVILGSVSDYSRPHREYDVKPVSYVPVFRLAQEWTLYVLKPFNKRAGSSKPAEKDGRSSITKSKKEVRIAVTPEEDKKNL